MCLKVRLCGRPSPCAHFAAAFSVVGVFGWSYSVLLPAYATDILHIGESGYGGLLSANGLVRFWVR